MARPPLRATRRPATDGIAIKRDPPQGVGAAATDVETDDGVDREAILAELETALRGQPGIGQEGLDFLMPFLRDAVEQASLAPSRVELDADSWMATFDAIAGDALGETERNSLLRQINEAIEPLNDDAAKLALEFSRRLQGDGEPAALEWLAGQRKAAEKAAAAAPLPPDRRDVPVAGAQTITRSRSRRLRGPPG